MKTRRILFIDDQDTCHLFDVMLSQINKNFVVTCASTKEDARELIKKKAFDLYVLEPYRNGMNGIELCKSIRQQDPQTPVIFYSGTSRELDRSVALAAGADAYLVKGSDLDKFIATVEQFLA